MIVRIDGLIAQHDIYDPNKIADCGDSSRSTGIMSLCGSEIDQKVITKHYYGHGLLVRHPTQGEWAKPRNFTRDQLIPLSAGMWMSNHSNLVEKVFWRRAENLFFCQNTYTISGKKKVLPDGPDILGPDTIWHLILCGRIWYMYWFAPIGYLFQLLTLLFNCYVTPMREQNQIFCMMYVSGLLPLYLKLHPDFDGSMKKYWCEWRDQCEVKEVVVNFVKKEALK